jgi:uncharacterized membrane protein YdbT with pleckstrin-like domain
MVDEPPAPIERRRSRGAEYRIPLPGDVTLMPDEEIVKVGQFHPGIYWKGVAVFALAIVLLIRVFNLGVFILLVAGVMLALAYLTKHYLLLILTNRRLLIRTGILRMDTVQLSLERVESVELERTIMGQFLGYAAVVVTGTGSRVMAVPFVEEPQKFRQLIDQQIFSLQPKN